MLRIEHMTLREVGLALKEPFQISSGTQSHRRIFLVELIDADGVQAWGECAAAEVPNYGPETIDTCWHAIREWVAPRVLGVSFDGPEAIWPVLQKDFRGHHMAKAAVEMAAWALAAIKEGVSLAQKLGGTRERIAVGISLGIQKDPETLVAKARGALERGYRKVKIKIKPGADVDYVRAVREELGPEAPLMADANNAYSLADRDRLAALDELGLLMIEQPLAWDDLLRHAELQKHLKTPICLDESITGLERAEDMVALGAGRIVNVKPGRVGGFASSLAIHDFCQSRGIPVWCGGMLESGIGRAHNVALASLPNFTLPGDVSPSERYWERDLVDPEWTMDREGWIEVPRDKPGLGVTPDLNRIDDLTVRRADLETTGTTRVTVKPGETPPRGDTDWARVNAMTDEEVLAAARSDPDAQPLSQEELAKMRRVSPVKVLRQRLGMTQVEFAEAFGLPISTLRDWEQRRSTPDAPARALLRAIDRDPETMRRLLARAA